MNKRKHYFIASAWAILLFALTYSFLSMRNSVSRLHTVAAQEQECRQLVDSILNMQNRPGFAALGVDSPRTITARAEEASTLASLPASAVARIEPQSSQRLGDSPYRLRPTRIELRNVTLEQLIAFSHAMIDETQGTTIRDLRLMLSDTRNATKRHTEWWTAELVLTQLVFAPSGR